MINTKRILIMGLPGAGKTTLARAMKAQLESKGKTVEWLNADEIRKKYNDWDFTDGGRIRQAYRMASLAFVSTAEYVIADFVAPMSVMRTYFDADWTVFVDTIDEGRFEDTNKVFEPPEKYDFRIVDSNTWPWADTRAAEIVDDILWDRRKPEFDFKKESVQMLGRWQPWHAGHTALFERAIAKTGQVVIMIRDCQGWNGSNPFDLQQVKNRIRRALDSKYQGRYHIMVVPNIVNITYGRDVGYKIEQEVFDEDIHAISATKIRKEMGLE